MAQKALRNITLDERKIVKNLENYITEFYGRADRPENLKVKSVEEVDKDVTCPYILYTEVEKS
jgi:hypothetical protein